MRIVASDPMSAERRRLKSRLRTMTSVAAMATLLAMPMPREVVFAAGFNSANTSPFSGTGYSVNSGHTQVDITAPTAVIDWQAATMISGSGSDFLPVGDSVLFQGDANAGHFTVLNRISVSDNGPIQFNGTITSQVNGGAQGGSLWFYSPGGILVGGSAIFNVGSLLLTTGDPAGGGSTIDPDSTITMDTTTATDGVIVSTGAQINATGGLSGGIGNYVAMVSPIVQQSGTVTVNGSAAYVAGETVNLTINQGLFDIVVTAGSDTPVEHNGTTQFQSTANDPLSRAIYLVSVPKNSAITMALNPTKLGFQVATEALVEDGVVVLSSGYDVQYDSDFPGNFRGGQAGGTCGANICAGNLTVNGGLFSADTVAQSSKNSFVLKSSGTTQFSNNLSVFGLEKAHVGATGGTIDIARNLIVDSSAKATDSTPVTAGEALAYAESGGTLHVGGYASIYAYADGVYEDDSTTVVTAATAGEAKIFADNGTIIIGDDFPGGLEIAADVLNFDNSQAMAGDFAAAEANGGLASINVLNNGQITVEGDLSMYAGAHAIAGTGNSGGAYGGDIEVFVTSGSLNVSQGNASIFNAVATAGNNADGIGVVAFGGTVKVQTNGATATATFTNGTASDVSGIGGWGSLSGGAGTGGYSSFETTANGGTLNIGSHTQVANGVGGRGTDSSSGVLGGDGIAGAARIFAAGGLINAGSAPIELRAESRGGSAFDGGGNAIALLGPDDETSHGAVAIRATGGEIRQTNSTSSFQLYANSIAGDVIGGGTAAGGTAVGGFVDIVTSGTGKIDIAATVDAQANGTVGQPFGQSGGNHGGSATGGVLRIVASSNQLLRLGGYTGAANGVGGDSIENSGSSSPGSGTGGTLSISVSNAANFTMDNSLTVHVDGFGGEADSEAGGTGTGGVASITTSSSNTANFNDIQLYANGKGGDGTSGGGDGLGGIAIIGALGGSMTTQDAQLFAQGVGGNASQSEATGGDGIGGLAGFKAQFATLTLTGAIEANTTGTGGQGYTGGDGKGGGFDTTRNARTSEGESDLLGGSYARATSGTINANASQITLYSIGIGGASVAAGGSFGSGGDGFGGYAELLALRSGSSTINGVINAQSIRLDADGRTTPASSAITPFDGEDGPDGGDATGGIAVAGAHAGNGRLSTGTTQIDVYANAGGGGAALFNNNGAGGAGGRGGDATGGTAYLGLFEGGPTNTANNGFAHFGAVTISAYGQAAAGGAGGGGNNNDGGLGGDGGDGTGGGIFVSGAGGYFTPAGQGSAVQAVQMLSLSPTADGRGGLGGVGGTNSSPPNAQAASGSIGEGIGGTFELSSTNHASQAGYVKIGNSLFGDVSGLIPGPPVAADTTQGRFVISASNGTIEIGSVYMTQEGTTPRPINRGGPSLVSATNNGTLQFNGPFTAYTGDGTPPGAVTFVANTGGTINFPPPPPPSPPPSPPPFPICSVNSEPCDIGSVSPPPPIVSPPPPVVSPPPPPVDPSPPPPPVEPSPPPPVSPPPVDPSPPPPVDPSPPPPPVVDVPEVVETVAEETTKISSSIQASLTGSRVAGGTVSSSGDGGGAGATGTGGSSATAATNNTDGGGDAAAADEGGDDDSSEGGATAAEASPGNANVVVDMSGVSAGPTQIDTPITSSGNSSLWAGSDGIGEVGAGPDSGGGTGGATGGTGGPGTGSAPGAVSGPGAGTGPAGGAEPGAGSGAGGIAAGSSGGDGGGSGSDSGSGSAGGGDTGGGAGPGGIGGVGAGSAGSRDGSGDSGAGGAGGAGGSGAAPAGTDGVGGASGAGSRPGDTTGGNQ